MDIPKFGLLQQRVCNLCYRMPLVTQSIYRSAFAHPPSSLSFSSLWSVLITSLRCLLTLFCLSLLPPPFCCVV